MDLHAFREWLAQERQTALAAFSAAPRRSAEECRYHGMVVAFEMAIIELDRRADQRSFSVAVVEKS